MTEMVIYRLNRVPDSTYIHFLNFIGERQGPALPATTLVAFQKLNDKTAPVEIPRLAEVATEQTEDVEVVFILQLAEVDGFQLEGAVHLIHGKGAISGEALLCGL